MAEKTCVGQKYTVKAEAGGWQKDMGITRAMREAWRKKQVEIMGAR